MFLRLLLAPFHQRSIFIINRNFVTCKSNWRVQKQTWTDWFSDPLSIVLIFVLYYILIRLFNSGHRSSFWRTDWSWYQRYKSQQKKKSRKEYISTHPQNLSFYFRPFIYSSKGNELGWVTLTTSYFFISYTITALWNTLRRYHTCNFRQTNTWHRLTLIGQTLDNTSIRYVLCLSCYAVFVCIEGQVMYGTSAEF